MYKMCIIVLETYLLKFLFNTRQTMKIYVVHTGVKQSWRLGGGQMLSPGGQLPLLLLLHTPSYPPFYKQRVNFIVFFPSFQLQTLISEQLKDTKLMASVKSHPNDYLQIKNVYCKKTIYKGYTYYPICWPSQLNKALLQKSHIVSNILHLRKEKLFSQLRPFFHIRGYNAAFEELDCKHCETNLKARRPKIPHGISFNIKQCRSFISIDVCTVDSSMQYGSF